MVRLLLVFFFVFPAHADFLGFGKSDAKGKVPSITEKLRSLSLKDNPSFEEDFNKTVKELELAVEAEKLFCKGEASGADGQVLPQSQRELCFRELKKAYLESTRMIYEIKKKYLGHIHAQQLEKLGAAQKHIEANLEKSF